MYQSSSRAWFDLSETRALSLLILVFFSGGCDGVSSSRLNGKEPPEIEITVAQQSAHAARVDFLAQDDVQVTRVGVFVEGRQDTVWIPVDAAPRIEAFAILDGLPVGEQIIGAVVYDGDALRAEQRKNLSMLDWENLDCTRLTDGIVQLDQTLLAFEINKLVTDLEPDDSPFPIENHRANLITLTDRLNTSCGNIQARLICYDCIMTFPGMSEIEVTAAFESLPYVRILDIWTPHDGLLSFAAAHDPYGKNERDLP